MSDQPKYRDGDWLREKYVEEERTMAEMAELCGCSSSTIGNWIKKHEIETRTVDTRVADERLTDTEWLTEQYTEQEKTTTEIAQICDCDPATVAKWLRKNGIESRERPRLPDERLTQSEWLRKHYVRDEKTTTEIAELCGCAASTVQSWLKDHGITTRSNETRVTDERLKDSDWLHEQYIEQNKTTKQIANECDCTRTTVSKYLHRNGIETQNGRVPVPDERLKSSEWLREQYIQRQKSTVEIANECGCADTTVRKRLVKSGIETRDPAAPADERLADEDWMREQYEEKGRSTYEIAQICDCEKTAPQRWLQRHGIDSRDPGEWDVLSGEDHPNWNGGTQPYGPGWNESKKRSVRRRDNYTCQDPRCSVTQEEHLDERGQKLHVHHLRKARDIDEPEERNAKENLITLCRDCHRRWEKIADAGLVPEVVADD